MPITPHPHPKDLPLEQWSESWLKMEVASLLDVPGYIMMRDDEREAAGFPATAEQRREFIRGRREADAILGGNHGGRIMPDIDSVPSCGQENRVSSAIQIALHEKFEILTMDNRKLRAALQKIADLVDSDALEPLDDAIKIATDALAAES